MQNQNQWTLLKNPIIFYIRADTTQLSLADLPPQARKAKLHICLLSGGCNNGETVTWTFFTKVDIIKICGRPHWQNAQTIYSENCTIRLDERKIIEVSRDQGFPGPNFGLSFEVLGYK
ncbi:unnamed protein product [Paramecium pentaurelia]|uniref:Uncharacterized protein n=1 Tax=Paramecium pentaurelia TaxID=43138 RepID=A0A8S1WDT8_9CILI|nr:unnamed protein product [Paramecium pentaurelia]